MPLELPRARLFSVERRAFLRSSYRSPADFLLIQWLPLLMKTIGEEEYIHGKVLFKISLFYCP